MKNLMNKFLLLLIAASVSTVAIELIPVSKQAASWNRCLRKTVETLKQVRAVQLMDDKSKEVISVMICNGAVFEPKLNSNTQ